MPSDPPAASGHAAVPYNSAERGFEIDGALAKALDDVADPVLAERIARLEADADLVLALQLQDFDVASPEWKVFQGVLVEYGYAVFVAWLVTGVVYRMAKSHAGGRGVIGLGKLPQDLRLDADAAHELATELMITSVRTFRATALATSDPRRRWSSQGGASLRTYFIGRCLMDLPDVYVRYARTHQRVALDVADLHADGLDWLSDRSVDPEKTSLDRNQLDAIFAGDADGRAMYELQRRGYSYNEIAEMLSAAGRTTTEGIVRTEMSRIRSAAKARK